MAAQPPVPSDLLSGQELIYRGRFGAAHLYFTNLMTARPRDPAPPIFAAAALIWWAEARDEEQYLADSADALLATGATLAVTALDSAFTAEQRSRVLFWYGTAIGYRARQAELRGSYWRAAREARVMADALTEAIELDSTCIDCLLGIAVYEYALARASSMARLVARIVGLGGGDAPLSIARMRRVVAEGMIARTEARWVLANALLRDGQRDPALREEGLRLAGDLAQQYPENAAFRRAADPASVVGP